MTTAATNSHGLPTKHVGLNVSHLDLLSRWIERLMFLVMVLLVLLFVCLLSLEGQVVGQVKGTATYRERMALPPNAVFEATLEDVSKADAPAEVIGVRRPFTCMRVQSHSARRWLCWELSPPYSLVYLIGLLYAGSSGARHRS